MEDHILVVDDESAVRQLLSAQLQRLGYECSQASDGAEALVRCQQPPAPSVVITDIRMPQLDGVELLHRLKDQDDNIQVVMVSGQQDLDTVRRCLREGAYDYLLKPFEIDALANTVSRALERYHLRRENLRYRRNLERMVLEQTEEIRRTRDIALLTLAKLAESRDNETGMHLERIAAFSRRLAEELQHGPYAAQVTRAYIQKLYTSSPLHDIGKVGIPDAILRKPGPLTPREFEIMKTHTTIGGDTLRSGLPVGRESRFLTMAIEVAYSHHERWDGWGYPAGLTGSAIPVSARIVALADSYDALTSDRPYKSAVPHAEASRRIVADRGAHFDPVIVDAFLACRRDFATIGKQLRNGVSDEMSRAYLVADTEVET